MYYIGQKYGMPSVFYLDLWPISTLICVMTFS
jgi:hypothetical protein